MNLTSESFVDGGVIPVEFAFGRIDPKQHITLSDNRNPQLAWDEVPPGTRSFAIICHDYDVPSKPDDVNQEGREVPADLPRVDFYHWVLVDLPATESLATTLERVKPCWQELIAPDLKAGKNVLVAAHGNSMRALVKMLDNMSDEDIVGFNIPTGIPLVYELDDSLKPLHREFIGDPEAVKAAADAVAKQASGG